METWCEFRLMIGKWSHSEITDDQFYAYLVNSTFEKEGDKRVADLFITQHDGGEWTHAIYHRL